MIYWKTITTYLVDWSPTWIKTVELSNWIWKAIIIPRAKLKDVKTRQEVLQPAIYFLFWSDEEWKNLAYIWEAENLINRIWNHDTNKDFWDIVIAFISKDNNLTKADVKYLEAKAIEKAKKLNRYELLNWVEPILNNLPEHQISTMNEFLDNIDLLISAIWYPIIKDILIWNQIQIEKQKNNNLFFLKIRSCESQWIYNDDWFVVLKWSKYSIEEAKSFWWKYKQMRKDIFENWLVENDWKNLILKQDYIFSTPSSAASVLAWRLANWWTEWKNKDWKTLDEIERKNLKDN